MAAPVQTRQRLLDAGLAAADEVGLGELSVNDIVTRAQLAKGTFYVHFPDRTAFLVALHRRFHDELRAAMRAATATLPAGGERLRRGATAYLDGCLRATGVKAMLLQARGVPAIAAEVARSNDRFALASVADFETLGGPHPTETARLFVAMAAEVALLECASGRRSSKLRSALWHLARLE
ncbi:MAG: TetR/AcrR family transcriptional regulator [Microthrixaceae bacterium]